MCSGKQKRANHVLPRSPAQDRIQTHEQAVRAEAWLAKFQLRPAAGRLPARSPGRVSASPQHGRRQAVWRSRRRRRGATNAIEPLMHRLKAQTLPLTPSTHPLTACPPAAADCDKHTYGGF